jgi:hypothetical protein
MNYQNIYKSLITKRQKNPAKGYTERHHILPKSLGGSDDPTNLVVLSGREHWVAHLLLYKIHKNSQMLFACNMMAMRCEERGIAYIKSSRLYEAIRIEHSKRIGQWTAKKGKANSQYGTMWICNIELEENKKISKNDIIPEGWIKGRNKWNAYARQKEKDSRVKLKKPFKITNGIVNRYINFEDQLPIPDGWYKGVSYDEIRRQQLSKTASNSNKRRRGIKYFKPR